VRWGVGGRGAARAQPNSQKIRCMRLRLKRLYAARPPSNDNTALRGIPHKICAEEFPTKFAKRLCAAESRRFWGCPRPRPIAVEARAGANNSRHDFRQATRFHFSRAKLSDKMKRPAETDATPRLTSPQPDGRGMVMAALRLQHEALQQKRDAVVALARHAARNAVRRKLQAQGVKVALVPLSVSSVCAKRAPNMPAIWSDDRSA
jgi:hypothetical protein